MAASTVIAALLSAACADTFQPIAPGGPPFSIFGYLDASADTQFIRVSPLRSTLLASAAPTGIKVTLENLGTGQVIEMRDTTTRYTDVFGSDSLYAHNFWTAERVQPGASYRFRATGPDGAKAESIVRIPPVYGVEFWVRQRFTPHFNYVRVDGLQQVAFLFWNTYYYDGCHTSRFFRQIQPLAPGADSLTWLILRPDYIAALPRCGTGGVTITRQDVEVVGSDAAWPYGQDYSTWRLAPDSTTSNVTGALGFLGGVLTKWTRAEDCTIPTAPDSELYCKLRYDSTTATLRGSVSSACPIAPDSVSLTVRELAPPPGELPRTRYGVLDVGGNFDIGALRPGVPHQLIISVGDTTGRFSPRRYQVVYDTLLFTAGGVTTHQATLEPIGPCAR